jgi:hypothetical protein
MGSTSANSRSSRRVAFTTREGERNALQGIGEITVSARAAERRRPVGACEVSGGRCRVRSARSAPPGGSARASGRRVGCLGAGPEPVNRPGGRGQNRCRSAAAGGALPPAPAGFLHLRGQFVGPRTYSSLKLFPSRWRRAFCSGGTGVWKRPGMYQRKARPTALRWQMHVGGQPHRRPAGLWTRAAMLMVGVYAEEPRRSARLCRPRPSVGRREGRAAVLPCCDKASGPRARPNLTRPSPCRPEPSSARSPVPLALRIVPSSRP